MYIKVNRTIKEVSSKEKLELYSVEPKNERFEITLIVISHWREPEKLIGYALNKIGYCNSDNGFGIAYEKEIDFETFVRVPENHLLVTADSINKNQFIVSELEYLKILLAFFYSKNETHNAKIITDLIESL